MISSTPGSPFHAPTTLLHGAPCKSQSWSGHSPTSNPLMAPYCLQERVWHSAGSFIIFPPPLSCVTSACAFLSHPSSIRLLLGYWWASVRLSLRFPLPGMPLAVFSPGNLVFHCSPKPIRHPVCGSTAPVSGVPCAVLSSLGSHTEYLKHRGWFEEIDFWSP